MTVNFPSAAGDCELPGHKDRGIAESLLSFVCLKPVELDVQKHGATRKGYKQTHFNMQDGEAT